MFNFTLIYSVIIKDFVVAGIFNDKLGFILVHFDEMQMNESFMDRS